MKFILFQITVKMCEKNHESDAVFVHKKWSEIMFQQFNWKYLLENQQINKLGKNLMLFAEFFIQYFSHK